MIVNGQELHFSLTSPEDLRRYHAAGQRMAQAAEGVGEPPKNASTPAGFEAYIDYLERQCRLLTDFIDDLFGEGTCNQLLGPKTDLEKLLEICGVISAAAQEQSTLMSQRIQKYTPNRATRRDAK